jgi:cytochrome b6-f complex iron-sulfur subunit
MAEKRKENLDTDAIGPRRDFLSALWIGLGLAGLAELVWLVGSFLRPTGNLARENAPEKLMEAGPVDSFPPGTVTAFPRGRFYLVRLADGGFLTISRRCPHLGCTVPWVAEEKKFLCPCHSSAFDIRGDVLRSPASRAMDLYRVIIENAVVKVDTGHVTKRDRFKPEQVVYQAKT